MEGVPPAALDADERAELGHSRASPCGTALRSESYTCAVSRRPTGLAQTSRPRPAHRHLRTSDSGHDSDVTAGTSADVRLQREIPPGAGLRPASCGLGAIDPEGSQPQRPWSSAVLGCDALGVVRCRPAAEVVALAGVVGMVTRARPGMWTLKAAALRSLGCAVIGALLACGVVFR